MNTNPWQQAVDEQEENNRSALMQKDLEEQRAMLADSENAARVDAQETAQNQIFMRNLMGTIVKQSGGRAITSRLATWANAMLQKRGIKDMGVLPGGGFSGDGFMIPTYSGIDANGRPIPSRGIRYDQASLFSMMNQLRGIFGDNDRNAMARVMRNSGVGDDEITSISRAYSPTSAKNDPDFIGNKIGGGAGGRQIGGAATFKGLDTRPHGIHVFSSDGKGGFSRSSWTPEVGRIEENSGTRDPNYMGKWKVLESNVYGKRYENDKTGDVVFVKNGENPPWANNAMNGNMSEKERIAIMQDKGKTDRANMKNETRMSIEELKAELKNRGYDIDDKKFEESVRHNKATEKLGDDKLEHNKNRLENDKQQKQLDREAKLEIARLRSHYGQNNGTSPNYAKEMGVKIDNLEKIMNTGDSDARAKARQEIGKLLDEMISGDKETIKSGDNTNRNVVTDKNGFKWEIVRDENGKPIGKRRVK